MLSAFGFFRLSCSLLIDCFVKTKRRRRNRHRPYSDSDEEEFPPQTSTPSPYAKASITAAAKNAVAKIAVRLRPPQPVRKPRLVSILTSYLTKSKCHSPTNTRVEEVAPAEIWIKESEIRNRRLASNKRLENSTCKFFDRIPFPQLENDVESNCSLSTGECSRYPSDNESEGETSSYGDFDMRSEISLRDSSELIMNSGGFNPTFYRSEFTDDDDDEAEQSTMPQTTVMRRLTSVVNCDEKLKENVQNAGSSQLVLNPAYRIQSHEDSDSEEVEVAQTKLKSLQSAVKAGCHVAPVSTALVGSEYIGHTSLNLTYGDYSPESEEDEAVSPSSSSRVPISLEKLPPSPFCYATGPCHEKMEPSPFALDSFGSASRYPINNLAFCGAIAESADASGNMGTLTWRNVAFSDSDNEDDNRHALATAKDLQIQWKQTLHVHSHDLSTTSDTDSEHGLESSLFDDACMDSLPLERQHQERGNSSIKGINNTLVMPVRSISVDMFEDIDIRCQPTTAVVAVPSTNAKSSTASKHGQQSITTTSNKDSQGLLATGMKNTRWAIRSLTLLFDRIDVFSSSDKQK